MAKPKQVKEAKLRPGVQKKVEQVQKLTLWMNGSPVVGVVDIRHLPDRLLQAARKSLRGKADFVVMKNSVIRRAMAAANMASMVEKLDFPTAVVMTKSMSPYGLFKFFKDSRAKVAAKPGQIAPFDIIVHEGDTDLPPGPALSELKGAGINAQIKAGKIIIAKDSVVAKAGTKISGNVCKALQKLNVLPFEAGLKMAYAYEGGMMYPADVLDIDEKVLYSDMATCLAQALNVSINASYPTSQNAELILASAISQARNLAINGSVPSPVSVEALLTGAVGLGEALSSKVGSTEAISNQQGDSTKTA
jgi:large subunit ribosomal protein L10